MYKNKKSPGDSKKSSTVFTPLHTQRHQNICQVRLAALPRLANHHLSCSLHQMVLKHIKIWIEATFITSLKCLICGMAKGTRFKGLNQVKFHAQLKNI